MEFLWYNEDHNSLSEPKYSVDELDFGQLSNSTFFENPFSLAQGETQTVMRASDANNILMPEADSKNATNKDGQDVSSLRLGERGVINPLWQYNEYADPRTAGAMGINYGRVYNQKIRANNPIVFIQPGSPKFQATGGYLKGLVGGNSGYSDKLKKALVKNALWGGSEAAGSTFGMEDLIGELQLFSGNDQNQMKFYDFKPDWAEYRAYVAELSMELQTRMGITEIYKARDTNDSKDGFFYGTNDILSRFQKYYSFTDLASANGAASTSAEVQSAFLPFRVEKSTDAGDSFDNSTGDSMFAGMAKQVPDAAKEAMYLTKSDGDKSGGFTQSFVNGIFEGAAEMTSNISDSATAIIKNGGNLLFPEIWKESSYSKSLSLVIKLHSPYADPVCYFETVLFPLCCILGLALPRQVEAAVYAAPPLVRIRSKGWFSCDMGMITSVSIKRGADKNDWTLGRLPRSVEVTLNVKDLYGTMMMSLMGTSRKSFLKDDKSLNTALVDYLNIIGGLDTFSQSRLNTRLKNAWERFKRKYTRFVDPLTWQNGLQSVASKFTPVTKFTQNFFR